MYFLNLHNTDVKSKSKTVKVPQKVATTIAYALGRTTFNAFTASLAALRDSQSKTAFTVVGFSERVSCLLVK